jgi:hypothetical protein
MEHEIQTEELHERTPAGGRLRPTATTVAVALAPVGAALAISAGANDNSYGRVKVGR